MIKVGVVVFPGSNCDEDVYYVMSSIMGFETKYVWHRDTYIEDLDLIVLPGGFSYGDYLRCGAISSHSIIMEAIKQHINRGRYVIGICNGFQILTEAALLPGALTMNMSTRFICDNVYLSVENINTFVSNQYSEKSAIMMPIAHKDGRYIANEDTIKKLEDNQQIVFRYSNSNGDIEADYNPNGSLHNIAGIINEKGNVIGLMPHPERCVEGVFTGKDGLHFFESIAKWVGD